MTRIQHLILASSVLMLATTSAADDHATVLAASFEEGENQTWTVVKTTYVVDKSYAKVSKSTVVRSPDEIGRNGEQAQNDGC